MDSLQIALQANTQATMTLVGSLWTLVGFFGALIVGTLGIWYTLKG